MSKLNGLAIYVRISTFILVIRGDKSDNYYEITIFELSGKA